MAPNRKILSIIAIGHKAHLTHRMAVLECGHYLAATEYASGQIAAPCHACEHEAAKGWSRGVHVIKHAPVGGHFRED